MSVFKRSKELGRRRRKARLLPTQTAGESGFSTVFSHTPASAGATALTFGGASSYKKVSKYIATGGATFGGAATTSVLNGAQRFTHTASGGLVMSGIAGLASIHKYTPRFDGFFTLAWDAAVGATSYKLYYDTVSGPVYNGTGAAQGPSPINVGNVTQFTITGLNAGTTYYFAVSAVNSGGESPRSNEVSGNAPAVTIVFGGAAVTSAQFTPSVVGSGSLFFAGAGRFKKIQIVSGSGGFTTTGAATTSLVTGLQIFTHTASGGLVMTGTAGKKKIIKLISTSGPLVFSGAAGLTIPKVFAGSGQLTLTGTAGLKSIRAFLASGGVTTSGSATITLIGQGLFIYTATGGLVTSGAATLKKLKPFTASGGLVMSGDATFRKLRTISIAGGVLTMSGAAGRLLIKKFAASGGLITSGAGTTSLLPIQSGHFVYATQGGLITSGAATFKITKTWAGTGQLSFGGEAGIIIAIFGPASTITAAQLFAEMAPMLLENPDFSCSGLWTTQEILTYLNTTQQDFVLLGQHLKRVDPIDTVANQALYGEPMATMQLDRITFDRKPLYRTNRQALDLEDPKWKTKTGIPKKFHQDHLPKKTFELDRKITPAAATASLETVGTILPGQLIVPGDRILLPDYCAPWLKFGILASMLEKQGEQQDLAKANYCRQRFQFGAELFQNLMDKHNG